MTIERLSAKQRQALSWWMPGSPHRGCSTIIADGAVRSGKTLSLGLSFFFWSMFSFRQQGFALCGKTISALRRNLLDELLPYLSELGFTVREQVSRNRVTVAIGSVENRYHLFGGQNAGSAALIQGLTLSGVLFDEVALMPRSFVEQALARCSRDGARFWFNGNPDAPGHWFYNEWILKHKEKNALYLHFSMRDNPALSPEVRARYERLFSGVFYKRFVEGLWVNAEGLIYEFLTPDFCREVPCDSDIEQWAVSCDYGTRNPASFGLWGLCGGVWTRVDEFYYDSALSGRQRTDAEYVDDVVTLCRGRAPGFLVVDPSALSFITALRRAGFCVQPARNDVLTGIRLTAELLRSGRLAVTGRCAHLLDEAAHYRWKAGGRDAPVKERDHAMDDMRYFAMHIAGGGAQGGFAAVSVVR